MSGRDSGCSIFCCLRRPKTYSPAKKALDEDSPLNLNDIDATPGTYNIETEADNLTFGVTKELPEQIAKNAQGTADGDAPDNVQQNGAGTNEAITEVPSLQIEPPPECVNSVTLASSSEAENTEAGEGNGDVSPPKICESQLDAEAELALQVACLQQLVERLEAVADALEAASGSKNVCDASISGISLNQAELFNSGDGGLPSCLLDGSEWIVANHHDNKELLVHMIDDHQNVSIRNCNGCTIQIDGKPDTVSIDDCVKCGVIFRDVATSINVSNCQRVQIQGLGIVPCVFAKNSDGLSIYVSRDCSEVPVFSFKCSELNLLVPSEGGDGDFQEVPVPEQFRSQWNGDCWSTEVADIVA